MLNVLRKTRAYKKVQCLVDIDQGKLFVVVMVAMLVLVGLSPRQVDAFGFRSKNKTIDYVYWEVIDNDDGDVEFIKPDKNIYVPLYRWKGILDSEQSIWIFEGDRRYVCIRYPFDYGRQRQDEYYHSLCRGIKWQDIERMHNPDYEWKEAEEKWFDLNGYKVDYSVDIKKKHFEAEQADPARYRVLFEPNHSGFSTFKKASFGTSSTIKDKAHERNQESKQNNSSKRNSGSGEKVNKDAIYEESTGLPWSVFWDLFLDW